MNLTIEPMTKEAAEEILDWRYPYPYDFYNNELTEESLAEMLDGTYRAVRNGQGELYGFYCTGKSAQVPAGRKEGAYRGDFTDFGLGMKPAETGQGQGSEFFACIRNELLISHPQKPLRLTVAAFNTRAIRLYENFGFIKDQEFKNDFAKFQTMLEIRPESGERKTL